VRCLLSSLPFVVGNKETVLNKASVEIVRRRFGGVFILIGLWGVVQVLDRGGSELVPGLLRWLAICSFGCSQAIGVKYPLLYRSFFTITIMLLIISFMYSNFQ